jgi:hypothetical protein
MKPFLTTGESFFIFCPDTAESCRLQLIPEALDEKTNGRGTFVEFGLSR